jgi:REP element-mobilizing transposase RayT
MARRVRLDGPAVTHHVMVRGLGGAAIFLDTDDRQDFVDRLSRLLPECGARCFAWALMTNHVHLVLQTETGALSRVMRRLDTGYAVRFNRLRDRRGYLFMDRFRSRIVESDSDLIGLIRYVHGNPIGAGLVTSLDALASYPWCGHGALMGVRPALAFEAVGPALSLFDADPRQAREELAEWMASLGDGAVPAPAGAEGAAPRADAPRSALRELLRAACVHYGIAPHELGSGSKQRRIARARSAVAFIAVVELGETGVAVARALGVSRAAISAALDRGRRVAIEDGLCFAAGSSLRGESEI